MAYEATKDWLRDGAGTRAAHGAPAREAWVVVPSASDQARYPRALYFSAAGTVTGIPVDSPTDTAITFTAQPGWFPVSFRRISACPAGTVAVP